MERSRVLPIGHRAVVVENMVLHVGVGVGGDATGGGAD